MVCGQQIVRSCARTCKHTDQSFCDVKSILQCELDMSWGIGSATRNCTPRGGLVDKDSDALALSLPESDRSRHNTRIQHVKRYTCLSRTLRRAVDDMPYSIAGTDFNCFRAPIMAIFEI